MDRILARAQQVGTPLIDGEKVTFVWHGEKPPILIADFTDWERDPILLEQVTQTASVCQLTFPRDAYIEYAFLDPESETRIPDPFNPRTCPNGIGETNHFFYMPEAKPSIFTRRKRGIQKGTLRRHDLEVGELAKGRKRALWLYQPPTDEPVPLLLVYDGNDYLKRGKLTAIVDNMIAQKRIRPIAMAMIAHHRDVRLLEYVCNEATLWLVLKQLLPITQEKLNLVDPVEIPGAFGVLGASAGGLMAFHTALRAPQIFGRLISQSGAFNVEGIEFVVNDLVRYLPVPALKIWMDVGEYESLLHSNRRLHTLLMERGYAVTYREYPGGHNYTCWRNEVWRGLETLFKPGI